MPLRLSLKELFTGTTKKLKITRRVPDEKDPSKTVPKEVRMRLPQKRQCGGLSARPPATCWVYLHGQHAVTSLVKNEQIASGTIAALWRCAWRGRSYTCCIIHSLLRRR